MTIQELIEKHVEEQCKNCTKKDCNGIYLTKDNRTICEAKYD